MAHDAFVSYSKDDKETVDAISKALEESGLSCWYAPRDVPVGADWDASIVEALSTSRVMILVWSSHSDQSKQVKREVALALDELGVTVIPFRIESIAASKLRYYLSGIQWLDALTPPPEANLERLVEQVKIALPIVGQISASDEEKLRRSRMEGESTTEPAEEKAEQQPLHEGPTNADDGSNLITDVEVLQAAEAEALEEAEAAAYRQARLRAEVETLRRANAKVLPPNEAEVLHRAAAAEAAEYAEEKARLLAKVTSLHEAVETALKRAAKALGEHEPEAESLASEAKNQK
jgi:hypothetical protein